MIINIYSGNLEVGAGVLMSKNAEDDKKNRRFQPDDDATRFIADHEDKK
jgi:hypothetical protein